MFRTKTFELLPSLFYSLFIFWGSRNTLYLFVRLFISYPSLTFFSSFNWQNKFIHSVFNRVFSSIFSSTVHIYVSQRIVLDLLLSLPSLHYHFDRLSSNNNTMFYVDKKNVMLVYEVENNKNCDKLTWKYHNKNKQFCKTDKLKYSYKNTTF